MLGPPVAPTSGRPPATWPAPEVVRPLDEPPLVVVGGVLVFAVVGLDAVGGAALVEGDPVVAGALDGVVVVAGEAACVVLLVLCVAATTTSAARTASARTRRANRTGRRAEVVMGMVTERRKGGCAPTNYSAVILRA